jgi:hypothetical protein
MPEQQDSRISREFEAACHSRHDAMARRERNRPLPLSFSENRQGIDILRE